MFPMEHGSKTQKRASFHVQFPPLSLEEMAWNFYKLFPAKGWCHLYSIFCTWGIHKDVFLDTIGISFWLLVFLNGFPSKVFVEKWSVSIWMKHVVTMKYWLINDGTFCCGFWMISIQLRSIIPYHFYSSYTHFGMTSFIKVPSSFVWPSLWLVKYWWGDFFLIWSCCQICFWLCFPTIEMSSALCVSLIPWILWGIWNEESIFHTRPYLWGGDETLWSVACNSESHDQCQMHAFWATHFFLGFFLIYTGYKAGNACGKLGHCQLRWMWSSQQRFI